MAIKLFFMHRVPGQSTPDDGIVCLNHIDFIVVKAALAGWEWVYTTVFSVTKYSQH
jgi:hypothetical protein